MKLKPIPAGAGFRQITEAVTQEYGALMDLVRAAVREKVQQANGPNCYVCIEGMFADHAVVSLNGRLWSYPYTLNADNTISVGVAQEVVETFLPVREAAAMGVQLREAADGSIEVTLIQAGLSVNRNFYPDATLQDAAPMFEGVRVFAKSDADHIKGAGKDVRNLLGGVYGVRFVAGATPDAGRLVGTFRAIDPADPVVTKMTEAVKRGLAGLMGLSIDATARTARETRDGQDVRVAKRFVSVKSLDLIVEPGAGGGLDRLAEADGEALAEAAAEDPNPTRTEQHGAHMLKKHLAALAALNAAAAAAIAPDKATAGEVFVALTEACAAAHLDFKQVVQEVEKADEGEIKAVVTRLAEAKATELREAAQRGSGAAGDAPVTRADLAMIGLRSIAATRIAASRLPTPAQERLASQFAARERFVEADIDAAIKGEREYLSRMTESGAVRLGDGSRIEVADRSAAIADMLDAFFNPAHKNHRHVSSFKECYIEMTGDRRVTGRLSDCDMGRLRESLGALAAEGEFREAVNASTFSNALGSSITRRMMDVYGQQTDLQQWRQVASVTPVSDFRTQERVTIGGYGNLPTVAEAGGYNALTSPSDLKATYAVTKRGGTETVTLEAIKNDDVRVIRRIPVELALAAANTLYEFVFDFFRSNPTIYDSVALYHASHGNLYTAALSAAEYATHRLGMAKQTRLSSSKRRGITPARVLVPFDLQETAYNLFVRGQNLDKTFVQTINPMVIPVAYWTDANDWCTVADPMVFPMLEIGFLDGREEPELFTQDMPNVGSLFSNDQVTYKIRHIYGGAVVPEGEKGTTKAVVP